MTLTDFTVCIFAYGSNMCTQRIRSRVPSATPIANGHLAEHAFVFHKRSVDGSAKADAVFTARQTDQVWGVVYRLHLEDKPILDDHEFLGVGYDEQQVDIVIESGTIRAWMYVARREMTNPSLLPYSWYHDFVVRGAQQHRLPERYIEHLRSFESVIDPDSARHERNCRLIDW